VRSVDRFAREMADLYIGMPLSWRRRPDFTLDDFDLLRNLDGAGTYIAAMMRAAADVAWSELTVNLYGDCAMLCWVYNSTDLNGWKSRVAAKKAAGSTTFDPKGAMAECVGKKLAYLERGAGKPKYVLKPTP
jgi:hypothetical protein